MKIWIYWSRSNSGIYFYIVLNKNLKTYWSEQSFAGLRPEVRTGLFHDVYQRGISRNIFHDCGKFYLLFEWGIVVQELETSNFTAEWKLYRITAILKFETDIIANISARPIGWAGIFVMMSVEAFRTNFIVFIGDGIMCLTSDWPITCTCELRTDLIFLWIKVSWVIQTLSAAHIKERMSNLPIKLKSRILVEWKNLFLILE